MSYLNVIQAVEPTHTIHALSSRQWLACLTCGKNGMAGAAPYSAQQEKYHPSDNAEAAKKLLSTGQQCCFCLRGGFSGFIFATC